MTIFCNGRKNTEDMLFSNWFKRKKSTESRSSEDKRYVKIEQQSETSCNDVLDLCEQLVDAAGEFEDIREEYIKYTYFFNDCLKIEKLLENEDNNLRDVAVNVAKLNLARSELLKSESKLADTQFMQMQENENELPRVINRLKNNEKRVDVVKKNLKYIEGEKVEWEISREECEVEQKHLRILSVGIFISFAVICIVCLIASLVLKTNTQLWLLAAAFLAVLISVYIVIKYQECTTHIKQCDVNINHAITLMNKAKIKYVNAQSAVNYTCERFHVNNSQELNSMYDLYIEAVKEKEKFRKTSDDLDYYNKQLVNILKENNIYEPKMWLNYAEALINNDEMVEIKHDILEKRQTVRSRLGFCVDNIADIRAKIVKNKDKLGDKVGQINSILRKVSELNTSIPD